MMRQPLILIAVLLLLIVGIGYGFAWPAYQERDSRSRELRGAQNDLDVLQKKQDLVEQLAAIETTLSQRAEAAERLIPVQEERETFVSEIDQLATTHGVQLTTLTFSAPAKKKSADSDAADDDEEASSKSTSSSSSKKSASLKPLRYNATLTGSYEAIAAFLAALERAQRYTHLESLTVSTAQDGAVSASTTGNIYTLGASKIPANLSFKEDAWQYLEQRTQSLSESPTLGRANPFANLQ